MAPSQSLPLDGLTPSNDPPVQPPGPPGPSNGPTPPAGPLGPPNGPTPPDGPPGPPNGPTPPAGPPGPPNGPTPPAGPVGPGSGEQTYSIFAVKYDPKTQEYGCDNRALLNGFTIDDTTDSIDKLNIYADNKTTSGFSFTISQAESGPTPPDGPPGPPNGPTPPDGPPGPPNGPTPPDGPPGPPNGPTPPDGPPGPPNGPTPPDGPPGPPNGPTPPDGPPGPPNGPTPPDGPPGPPNGPTPPGGSGAVPTPGYGFPTGLSNTDNFVAVRYVTYATGTTNTQIGLLVRDTTTGGYYLIADSSYLAPKPPPGADNPDGAILSNATTCFLAGSMLRASNGDIAVEDVQIGDEIVAYDWKNNKESVCSVVWVGKARALVVPGLPDDEAGYPVRILKDAIGDGVPYKDMLITSEHCLFFEGRFVPVRMLVNGASIFYDRSITSYEYYHVETEQHSVITADGVLTESYLDTGNRSSFRQAGHVVRLGGKARTWDVDAGAPLCVDRSFVEPLFRTLDERAGCVTGAQGATKTVQMTDDPDLHLMTASGAVIRPIRKTANHYSFMLPQGTRSVRIVSRVSRPSDVIGPFVDDRRRMGVAVADVHFVTAKQQMTITTHLHAEKPAGWHSADGTVCAWTNGNAVLPLGDLAQGGMGILSLTILAAGPYQKQDAEVLLENRHSA